MKEFFKYVLATIVGLVITGFLVGVMFVMSLVGMVSAGEASSNVSDNTVLYINLNGVLQERNDESVSSFFGSNMNFSNGLAETLSAIRKAKKNDKIKGIYLEGGILSSEPGSLEELRNALLDFKKSGKWIIAYADNYMQSGYYVASVADKVYMSPQGIFFWQGLSAEGQYWKDALAKLGVKFQIFKVGRYKSATEMFGESQRSAADLAQTQRYLNNVWGNICEAVGKSRGISVLALNQYADRPLTMAEPQEIKKLKFVDGLLYPSELKALVKKKLKIDEDEDISQVSVSEMQNVKGAKHKGDEIAVYYAYGSIVDNEMQGFFLNNEKLIVGKDVCKDLEDLMNDDDVKAVVIRINSGGGSASASELMHHQIELLKAKKPVVVSMGGMAASGGYMMSCNANWIVAQPTTITGSIGIFGMFPEVSGLVTSKIGIHYDEVNTNANSGFISSHRPLNAAETSVIQQYINRGYSDFCKMVADGRKMSVERVNELGEGHVYTGSDALKIKLVDQLGGLNDAVAKAAKLAKLKEYHTVSYPAPEDFLTQLFNSVEGSNYLEENLKASLGEYYEPVIMMKNINQMNPIQARSTFEFKMK